MTGSGTQQSPYIPEDWDELKTACETEGAYVALNPGTEWDMNDQYPEDAPQISFKCIELDGRSAIIKNIRKSDGTLFGLGQSDHDVTLLNLNFESMYITNAHVFYTVTYSWMQANSLKLIGVRIGAELYDAILWYCENQGIATDQSSIALYLSNSDIGNNPKELLNTVLDFNGTVTNGIGGNSGLNLNCSALYGSVRSVDSQQNLVFGGRLSVIDITLQNFANVYGSSLDTTLVVNISSIGEADVYGDTLIQATSEQLKDAAWLNAAGFPCA